MRIAGKALILQLQHSKHPLDDETLTDQKAKTKQLIAQLLLQHQILSPHTVFVRGKRHKNGNNAGMVLRKVPFQISADDQHSRTLQFCNLHTFAVANTP